MTKASDAAFQSLLKWRAFWRALGWDTQKQVVKFHQLTGRTL